MQKNTCLRQVFFCTGLSFILHIGTVYKGDDVRSGTDAVGLKETVAVALSYTGLVSPHDGVIVGVANNVGKGIFLAMVIIHAMGLPWSV